MTLRLSLGPGDGRTYGHEVFAVERHHGKSHIVLRDDHGLRIRGVMTEECYFPQRKISGPKRFVITNWTTRKKAKS